MLTEHGGNIAPNPYWVAKKRPPSARALRDEDLKVEILRVYGDNLDVYGADKVWIQLNREGTRVARCTVERLMGDPGLSGVRRGKAYKVTTQVGRTSAPPERPGRLGLHGQRHQPAVGGGPDRREDPRRVGVRLLHRRRLQPDGRGLAAL